MFDHKSLVPHSSPPHHHSDDPPPPTNQLPSEPYCFIAYVDSQLFITDIGANCIIVNDAALLCNLEFRGNNIKCIGGSPVSITGVGKLDLKLKSDNGKVSLVKHLDAVLVPSSPYNPILPQLLVAQMKTHSYSIRYFYYDDINYIFSYRSNSKTFISIHLRLPSLAMVSSNSAPMTATRPSCVVQGNSSLPTIPLQVLRTPSHMLRMK